MFFLSLNEEFVKINRYIIYPGSSSMCLFNSLGSPITYTNFFLGMSLFHLGFFVERSSAKNLTHPLDAPDWIGKLGPQELKFVPHGSTSVG